MDYNITIQSLMPIGMPGGRGDSDMKGTGMLIENFENDP
jgi:hypothetical protein